MKLKILRMLTELTPWHAPEKMDAQGKPYPSLTLYGWNVDCEIDGKAQTSTIELKTKSKEIFATFAPGKEFEGELKQQGNGLTFRVNDRENKFGNKGGGWNKGGSSGKSWVPKDFAAEEAAKMPGFSRSYAKDMVCAFITAGIVKTLEEALLMQAEITTDNLQFLRAHAPTQEKPATEKKEDPAKEPAKAMQEKTLHWLGEYQKEPHDIGQQDLEKMLEGKPADQWGPSEWSILEFQFKRLESGKIQRNYFVTA